MSTPDFPESPGAALTARAARARREFYRLLPHFAHLPEWENITSGLSAEGYAERAMRMWAVIARAGQSFPTTTWEESMKAALVGLDRIWDATLLAGRSPMQTVCRVELVDGMILGSLNEDDRNLYRQPRHAAEYLVKFAADLGAFSPLDFITMTTATTVFFRPVTPPWDDSIGLVIWQLLEPAKLPRITRRITSYWLSASEAEEFSADLTLRALLARLIRLASIHCLRAMDGAIRDVDGLAETGAWLLNLGCAIDLPDAQGFPEDPPLLRPTWKQEIDGPLFARLGKYAAGYHGTTAEAVAVVADWCEKQGRGPWEASEGWAPMGEWIYPAQP